MDLLFWLALLWAGSLLFNMVFSVAWLGLTGPLSFFSFYDCSASISLGWQASLSRNLGPSMRLTVSLEVTHKLLP